MAKLKLTKNEQKTQKDALKMYQRYLPTLTLKKQQLQSEIRAIDEKAKSVRAEKKALEEDFEKWISVFGEKDAFKPDMVTVKNIKKGWGNTFKNIRIRKINIAAAKLKHNPNKRPCINIANLIFNFRW